MYINHLNKHTVPVPSTSIGLLYSWKILSSGKFKKKLAVWRSISATAKLKSANISLITTMHGDPLLNRKIKIISTKFIAKVIWGRQPITNFNSHQYFRLYNILFYECDVCVLVHPMKLTKAPPILHQPRAIEMVAVVYRFLRNPPPGAHSCPETCYQGQPLWNVCTKMQAM